MFIISVLTAQVQVMSEENATNMRWQWSIKINIIKRSAIMFIHQYLNLVWNTWWIHFFFFTLPAQRGRVLYCYSFFFFLLLLLLLLLSSSSSICQHVNISETLCPIMLILGHNNKSANAHFWHDQFGVKGHVGVTGVKSPFSPKMLYLLQIKWYDHGTHVYSSARYPLQKLWV